MNKRYPGLESPASPEFSSVRGDGNNTVFETIRSVSEIDSGEWNRIAGDHVYASHEWLSAYETTAIHPEETRYFILRENGRLVAASVCHVSGQSLGSGGLDRALFGRLKKWVNRLGLSFHPALVCRPIWSFGCHILIDPDRHARDVENLELVLLRAMEEAAARNGMILAFLNVMSHEKNLVSYLEKNGYARTEGFPVAYMDVEWKSFEEYRKYVKGYSSKMESNIRTEMNRNRREGVSIRELEDPRPYEDRLVELLEINARKYTGGPFSFKKEFFSELKRNFGADAILYGAFKNNRLMGTGLFLRWRGSLYTPLVGIDHDLSGNDATYFNIIYDRPISDAIARRDRRIYFGKGMYGVKIRRGCRLAATRYYIRSFRTFQNRALAFWLKIHAAATREKIRREIPRGRESVAAELRGQS
jgi:predicted N-acyltransferase